MSELAHPPDHARDGTSRDAHVQHAAIEPPSVPDGTFVRSARRSATRPAITSANDGAPQKSTSPTPDSMAPGTASMIPLSTISMTAMLAVSDAKAIGATTPKASPARSSGRLVSV